MVHASQQIFTQSSSRRPCQGSNRISGGGGCSSTGQLASDASVDPSAVRCVLAVQSRDKPYTRIQRDFGAIHSRVPGGLPASFPESRSKSPAISSTRYRTPMTTAKHAPFTMSSNLFQALPRPRRGRSDRMGLERQTGSILILIVSKDGSDTASDQITR